MTGRPDVRHMLFSLSYASCACSSCSSECAYIPVRYCVPLSLPTRLSMVGSSRRPNSTSARRAYDTLAGSNTTRQASVWPVISEQTSA
eukprot:CAMPEP_0201985230 /NCGR_PEP_ID=MMETSP0904-20121228/86342_1 /ASSEMBLY_ACC=CAM_ASM_000553 /TAXON_ID=420261 /ORGANISM="Thalassiosira antarctica, Strain CCMP982" /LENGTH=87 /DNA_ID=CAMNT_0048538845 /DNA_START=461 /DNA_END=724 /DNA_ORIENTATION=+